MFLNVTGIGQSTYKYTMRKKTEISGYHLWRYRSPHPGSFRDCVIRSIGGHRVLDWLTVDNDEKTRSLIIFKGAFRPASHIRNGPGTSPGQGEGGWASSPSNFFL